MHTTVKKHHSKYTPAFFKITSRTDFSRSSSLRFGVYRRQTWQKRSSKQPNFLSTPEQANTNTKEPTTSALYLNGSKDWQTASHRGHGAAFACPHSTSSCDTGIRSIISPFTLFLPSFPHLTIFLKKKKAKIPKSSFVRLKRKITTQKPKERHATQFFTSISRNV